MSGNWRENRLIRCAIFIAVTLAPVMAVVALGILPLRDLLAQRDAEIAQNAAMLARLTAIADYKPHALPVDPLIETRDDYLTGPSPGVAIANLQARLKALSETSGARLRAVQGLPPAKEGALTYIGAKLNVFGPIQAVRQTIQAIEAARPHVFITAATMKLSAQFAMLGSSPAEPVIDAQLDVFGAFRTEGAP